jgi:hypothetical protein
MENYFRAIQRSSHGRRITNVARHKLDAGIESIRRIHGEHANSRSLHL